MIRPVVLVGANGMLAHMVRQLAPCGVRLHLLDLPEFDVTAHCQVSEELARLNPAVIINCAAFTRVDACESEQDSAYAVNGKAPGYLAAAAYASNALLVHISTDFVFAGDKTVPYDEDDQPRPLSVYGKSKLAGEQAIAASALQRYYIVRTSWLYGPAGGNFVATMMRLAAERDELGVVADQVGTPTFSADLAAVVWRLVELETAAAAPTYGIYHYSNAGECSWYDFTCAIVAQMRQRNLPCRAAVKPITSAEYPLPAPRPAYSVLSKDKIMTAAGIVVPAWQDSLAQYFDMNLET